MKKKNIDKPLNKCNEFEILQKYGLTVNQKIFCELFASDKEFMGDGVQSYIEAFDVDVEKKGQYGVAGQMAYRLLKKVQINNYISDLLSKNGLNPGNVRKQLGFLINQNADLSAKKGSIETYFKFVEKIAEKHEISIIEELNNARKSRNLPPA